MDSTTTLLIINPKAGTDSKRGIEEMVTTRLGFRPEVAYTSGCVARPIYSHRKRLHAVSPQ